MMRSEQEVRDMLKLFDKAADGDGLDEAGEGIQDTLLWILESRTDNDLKSYLPE